MVEIRLSDSSLCGTIFCLKPGSGETIQKVAPIRALPSPRQQDQNIRNDCRCRYPGQYFGGRLIADQAGFLF